MSEETRQYSVSVFPAQGPGDAPSSAVKLEITGEPKDVDGSIEVWKAGIRYYRRLERSAAEDVRFRICDGSGEDIPAVCEEYEIISSLMDYFCNICRSICGELQVTVKEILYQGTVYTDIEVWDPPLGVSVPEKMGEPLAAKIQAEKNGRDVKVYFFAPCGRVEDMADISIGQGDSAEADDGTIITEAFDEAGAGGAGEDDIWRRRELCLEYSCSGGIVEVADHRMYIADYAYTEALQEDGANGKGKDGDPPKVELPGETFAMNFFLETDGQDLTFSVLLDGVLYKKLSRDAERIVFYYTPVDRKLRTSDGFRQGESPKDLVFRNVNGKYKYYLDKGSAGGFSDLTLAPPPTPEPGSLDVRGARALYVDYLEAIHSAMADSVRYKTAIGDFYGIYKTVPGGGVVWAAPRNGRHLRADGFSIFGTIEQKPFDLKAFREAWLVEDTVGLFVRSVSFTEAETGRVISLSFSSRDGREPYDLEIRITPDKSLNGKPYSGLFSELHKMNVFRGVKLPKTIEFSRKPESVARDFWIYQDIRHVILDYGVDEFVSIAEKKLDLVDPKEIESTLYPNGEIPDDDVTALAVRMKRQFNRTGEIPGIALAGQAGTGKSTIAERLGELFGVKVHSFSPSDLKGQYIGHTEGKVVCLLAETLLAGEIFFIDEAYELMSDRFGQEAVSLLLPIMSRNRKTVTREATKEHIGLTIDFEKKTIQFSDEKTPVSYECPLFPAGHPGYPIIWMGGYEDEIRLMLGENKGLYRRMERVTLKTPTADELFDALNSRLKALKESIGNMRFGTLERQFNQNKEMLTNFFYWAGQTQNSRYFANYAGVVRFLNNCVDGIDFMMTEEQITGRISEIIASMKRDIKRQLDVVRRKGHRAASYDDDDTIQMVVDNKTRFEDLSGCDSQIRYLQRAIDMFKEKSFFEQRGVTIPKGVLLLGPPGVGKTFIARAMAGELQAQFEEQLRSRLDSRGDEADKEKRIGKRVGFMSLSAPELTARPTSFIGSVFGKAEEYDVCVIFIDEVDAIAKKRFLNDHYSHFIELIKQMDGVEQRANVFIMAATNAPESLDPAFVRAGRIDKKLEFTLPDRRTRMELAKRQIKKRCGVIANFSDSDENEKRIGLVAGKAAGLMPGKTPGDIENIINEAFIMYHEGWTPPPDYTWPQEEDMRSLPEEWGRLYYAVREMVERHSVGDPRPIAKEKFHVGKNGESRSATAVHEVGHALVSILCGCEPFESITCLPRGDALGYVMPKRSVPLTKKDYENRICTAMGGRIAEEIVYGPDNVSTGASADIRQATVIAREMVERVGFTDDFGFMTVKESTARYLGEDKYSCSDSFRAASDRAVSDLLKRLYSKTKEMLSDKEDLIVLLALAAFEVRIMTGEVFMMFYDSLKNMPAEELAKLRKRRIAGIG